MLATARLFGQSLGAALVAVAFGIVGAKLATLGLAHIASVRYATPLALWAACAIAAIGALVSVSRRRKPDVSRP
jgi:MFS transporter, DHA2 family, multidrug resistance protein